MMAVLMLIAVARRVLVWSLKNLRRKKFHSAPVAPGQVVASFERQAST